MGQYLPRSRLSARSRSQIASWYLYRAASCVNASWQRGRLFVDGSLASDRFSTERHTVSLKRGCMGSGLLTTAIICQSLLASAEVNLSSDESPNRSFEPGPEHLALLPGEFFSEHFRGREGGSCGQWLIVNRISRTPDFPMQVARFEMRRCWTHQLSSTCETHHGWPQRETAIWSKLYIRFLLPPLNAIWAYPKMPQTHPIHHPDRKIITINAILCMVRRLSMSCQS
jgi:hypothetical protein